MDSQQEQALIDKLRELPLERIEEVEDFVDFLRSRNQEKRLTCAAAKLSEEAFRKIWDNPEDADYDRL
jgi:hypothetical protein